MNEYRKPVKVYSGSTTRIINYGFEIYKWNMWWTNVIDIKDSSLKRSKRKTKVIKRI